MDRGDYNPGGMIPSHSSPDGGAMSDRALVVRFVTGLGLLVGVSAAASHFFGAQFEELAKAFLNRFGVAGCAIGTWLADGFTFPIPPQVYMAMATDQQSLSRIFPFIVLGSMLGGVTGYLLSPYLARFRLVAEGVRRSEAKVRALSGKGWMRGVLVASVSPIAFSWLCYAAGLYRIPRPAFALLCMLRIPKLMLYQTLIWYTWK
jgi:membrane protein YqaA with SNARE-associated domain